MTLYYTKVNLNNSTFQLLTHSIQRDTAIDATSNGPSDSPHCNYYHFSPTSGFRVVVIDTYDVGALGYEATSTDPRLAEATRILAEKNPNTDKNSPLGMHGLDTRFVKYNGAVGRRQLQWLRRVLREANTAREKVLIAGKSGQLKLLFHFTPHPLPTLTPHNPYLPIRHSFQPSSSKPSPL